MARDIEEFLRKAAERRRQQQTEQNVGANPASTPQARSAPPPRPQPIEIIEADVVEAEPVSRRHEPRKVVESSVKSKINSSRISDHADGLGRLANQRKAAVGEDKVKAKFDRRDLSKLDNRPSVQDDVDSNIVGADISGIATDLIEMLRNPNSIRQAILLSEILQRPDFDDE